MKPVAYLIPILSAGIMYFNYMKFKRVFNPIFLVVGWWAFWLFVSNFSLTGLFVPESYTQELVLVMLLSFFLGSMIPIVPGRKDPQASLKNLRLSIIWEYFLRTCLILVPFILYYFLKAVNIFKSVGIIGYRDAVFGTPEKPSVLFGSTYIELLYNLMISPLIFLSLLASIVLFMTGRKRLFMPLFLMIIGMDAIMRLGRFNFYIAIVLLFLAYLFVHQRKGGRDEAGSISQRAFRRKSLGIAIPISLFLIILLGLSSIREERDVNIYETVKRLTVGYHTVGFVLFDSELEDHHSRMNSKISYGKSSLGGLEFLTVLFLKRIDDKVKTVVGESGLYKSEQRVVGRDENGILLYGNAFFTVLYTLYFDGREIFLVMLPFCFGYILSYRYMVWIVNGNMGSLILLLLLMYLAIFSLFYSPLEDPPFWIALLFVLSINRFGIGDTGKILHA